MSTHEHPQIILPNGSNPYALYDLANMMFDHSTIAEEERAFPLLNFQKTLLVLMTQYRFLQFQAPSQAGKTTIAALISALTMYAYPGCQVLFLSTIEEQAQKVLEKLREVFIKRCNVPSLRELSTDSADKLQLAETNSKFLALPHSIKALTGNPARLVILDEFAKFDRSPALIEAEAIARTGKTGGQVLKISTLFGEGYSDPKSPMGFKGNYFHYLLQRAQENRRNEKKVSISASFTYKVSPYLVANLPAIKDDILQKGGNMAYFNEHYLGIPRKTIGNPVFAEDYSEKDHYRPDKEVPLNSLLPLFVSFDPGLTKACVVGQVDTNKLRLVYLRAYKGDRTETFEEFVKKCWAKVRKAFPHWALDVHCDVAGRRQNDQTLQTYTAIISNITNQFPTTLYQNIEPGIQILRSFMHRRDGFYVSHEASWLHNAFLHGLIYKPPSTTGAQEVYVKDGDFEHVGDACRYPVYSIMNGHTPEVYSRPPMVFEDNDSYYRCPITGY